MWEIVYKKAIKSNGELLFPERLGEEKLSQLKKTMGSYMFANQYLNQIIPEDEQVFKREWIKYYDSLPKIYSNFAFIDPAIGLEAGNDFTGIVVVSVDPDMRWFIQYAARARLTPTGIVDLCFRIHKQFNTSTIGVENVAFQQALIYMLAEEMKKRKSQIPVTGINPGTNRTKEMRIRSLMPRFEWGNVLLNRGLADLELELSQFPRGGHDDIIDALSSIDSIVIYPEHPKEDLNNEPSPHDPRYESWYIRKQIQKRKAEEE